MNGKMSVKSVSGKGSCFEIRLQNVKVAAADMTIRQPEVFFDITKIFFEHATVLVADDIESNRNFFRE